MTGPEINSLLADAIDGVKLEPVLAEATQELLNTQKTPATEKRSALITELGNAAFGSQFSQYLSFK